MNGQPELSPEVIGELKRLGGQAPPADSHADADATPAAIARFLAVDWPASTFASSDDSPMWVWHVQLMDYGPLKNEDFFGEPSDRRFAIFGQADGGNYFLVIDLGDDDPADPQVYRLDHEDPETGLRRGVRLSAFLASLQPER
jgi:hypothetical protein